VIFANLHVRVVLDPKNKLSLSSIRERKLLVAKTDKKMTDDVGEYHDLIIVDADKEAVERVKKMGKRPIVVGKEIQGAWGVLISSF